MEYFSCRNIVIKCSRDYYDIRRIALLMHSDKDLLFDIIQEFADSTDDIYRHTDTAKSIICPGSQDVNILFKRPIDLDSCSAFTLSNDDLESRIKDLLICLRRANKRGDKDCANKVFSEFMNYPKESAVLCLMECLSSLSPEKREKIVGHVIGKHPENEHSVAIDIIKRGDEHKCYKDRYSYYVCFRNCKNREKRIVRFENHASASIYVMYIIDRYIRRYSNGPIDVLKNLDLLKKIHTKMFGEDERAKGFGREVSLGASSLYTRIEKNRLSQYFNDINNTISKTINEWDFVLPYRCDSSTPIRLNPDLISVPKELIPEDWVIKV